MKLSYQNLLLAFALATAFLFSTNASAEQSHIKLFSLEYSFGRGSDNAGNRLQFGGASALLNETIAAWRQNDRFYADDTDSKRSCGWGCLTLILGGTWLLVEALDDDDDKDRCDVYVQSRYGSSCTVYSN